MKELNQYILEKFKISKNIVSIEDTNISFSKGDKLLKIEYLIKDNDYNTFIAEIVIFENNESDDKFTYHSRRDGKVITNSLFVNSNGYYESINKDEKTIFLPKEIGLKFIEDLGDQNGKTIGKFLKDYYDKDDKEVLNDIALFVSYNIDSIKKELS